MLPSSMGNAIKHAIRIPDPNNQDAMESRREELILLIHGRNPANHLGCYRGFRDGVFG